MSNTDTGGPAFPLQDASTHQFHGLSIRDYFAAKAMQSYLNGDDRDSFTFDEWAKASYQMADAMLKAGQA